MGGPGGSCGCWWYLFLRVFSLLPATYPKQAAMPETLGFQKGTVSLRKFLSQALLASEQDPQPPTGWGKGRAIAASQLPSPLGQGKRLTEGGRCRSRSPWWHVGPRSLIQSLANETLTG